MPCKSEEILSRFVDNDLDAGEATEFRGHLANCPSCKVRLHEIRESEKAVQEVVTSSFPTGQLAEKVLLRIQKELPNHYPAAAKKATQQFLPWKWLMPAFGVLLAICLTMFLKTPGQNPVSKAPVPVSQEKEFVWIAPLGTNAWAGDRKLVIGEFVNLESSVLREFRGIIALCVDQEGKNKVTWDGNGTFSASNDIIKWESGTGEFDFTMNRPVVLQVNSVSIYIYGTRIQISGKAGLSVRINLLEGKASFIAPDGRKGFLFENVPILVKGDRVELFSMLPGGQASMAQKPGSGIFSQSPGKAADPDKNDGWILESHTNLREESSGGPH